MEEKHFILKAGSVEEIMAAQKDLLGANSDFSVAMKRYFLSSAGQKSGLPEERGAISYIIQPPLDGSTIAVWLYLVSGVTMEYRDNTAIAREDGRTFWWVSSMIAGGSDSAGQTSGVLEAYQKSLADQGMSIAGNCARTWFFVNDIDNNYAGFVRARRENFIARGLTPQTHYIASTGIAGTSPYTGALVQMDAYAVDGDFKQTYLFAPTHLNPTYEYGVTFERGVKLELGDHVQILISGTASIDNKGRVLHIGDVEAQALRMLENVQALLAEADSGWHDVRVIIVYLRNVSDYDKIAALFRDRFSAVPHIITHAPVCRPDWLIEMECIADDRVGVENNRAVYGLC